MKLTNEPKLAINNSMVMCWCVEVTFMASGLQLKNVGSWTNKNNCDAEQSVKFDLQFNLTPHF